MLEHYIQNNEEKARAKKAPDFRSRIKGHIDILGINHKKIDGEFDENPEYQENFYVLKRAMMLNSMLKRVFKKRKVLLSNDVLRALLYVGKYENDARSMEAILKMSKISSGSTIKISDIPPSSQLELHVDPDEFQSWLRDRIHWEEMIGRMARGYARIDNHC